MIQPEDILNLNFYKKERFTGSYHGMRYLIRKGKAGEEEDAADCFEVYAWAGPYIFDITPDEKKISAIFPFNEEGRIQVVDWLNETYQNTFAKKKDIPNF